SRVSEGTPRSDPHQQHQPDPGRRFSRARHARAGGHRGGVQRHGARAVTSAMSREEFEQRLQALGARYHIHHPFNVRRSQGWCTPPQIRGWVANRYYYQISIPIKDAAMLSNCPDRSVRREWIQRILDHDGHGDDGGGIEAWLQLGQAVGIAREEMMSL